MRSRKENGAGEEYNSKGSKIRETDPLGRETVYVYGTGSTPDPDQATGSGIDLLQVKQKNGSNYDLLSSTTYDSAHRPLTVTDASGKTTTYTYNSAGQVLTVVTPERSGITENRTTTYSYDTNGYLQSVTAPATGATTSYTYDSYGRVRTVTDADSHVLTYDYDALDRVTRVTYPDATFEETVYNRLDPEARRDRLGRWTRNFLDPLRRVVSTTDPLGRTTTFQWCTCGSMDKLVDPNGNVTTWERDLQGRVTSEIRANASHKDYVYESTTSRLKQVTDAKSQVIEYEYFNDDNLKEISYTNEEHATSDVTFTYDSKYNRRTTMVDGTGTTTWSYTVVTDPPSLGATSIASIDGPLSNDTIAYTYDELGRVKTRTINGSANSQTYAFDALGRVTSQANLLGTFSFTYEGVTGRLDTVTYPNGQTTVYAYEDNNGDHRLKEIHNKLSGGSTLSKFNYTTDAVNIKTWTQEAGSSSPTQYTFGYDAADQLMKAVLADTTPTVLKRYGYGYDKAGNRTTEQIDNSATASAYDNMNRLTGQQPGGALTFAGTVNEAATVLVQGKPATVSSSNAFEGKVDVGSGTTTVTVQATDPSSNVRTNTYDVTQSGSSKSFTYDANGNLTSGGTRTFEWDAENRLVRVRTGADCASSGTTCSEFTYNGEGRRVRIVEKVNGATTTEKRFLWGELRPEEERDASGTTVNKRYFSHGIESSGTKYFIARDHQGSLRDLTDNAGTIRARYDYEPYGRRTQLSGDLDAEFGFTGHYYHVPTSLHLPLYRPYSGDVGRWLAEDPSGFQDGANLYSYVLNNPVNRADPNGLATKICGVVRFDRVPQHEPGAEPFGSCRMVGECYTCPRDPNDPTIMIIKVWVLLGKKCPLFCVFFMDSNKPKSTIKHDPGLTACVR